MRNHLDGLREPPTRSWEESLTVSTRVLAICVFFFCWSVCVYDSHLNKITIESLAIYIRYMYVHIVIYIGSLHRGLLWYKRSALSTCTVHVSVQLNRRWEWEWEREMKWEWEWESFRSMDQWKSKRVSERERDRDKEGEGSNCRRNVNARALSVHLSRCDFFSHYFVLLLFLFVV